MEKKRICGLRVWFLYIYFATFQGVSSCLNHLQSTVMGSNAVINFRHWHPASTNIPPGRYGVVFELTYVQFAYKNAGIDNVTITSGLCESGCKYTNTKNNNCLSLKIYHAIQNTNLFCKFAIFSRSFKSQRQLYLWRNWLVWLHGRVHRPQKLVQNTWSRFRLV